MAQADLSLRTLELRFHWSEDGAEGIATIDVHPMEPRVLTAGYDRCCKIWDVDALHMASALADKMNPLADLLKFRAALTTTDNPMPNCARWSPAGKLVVSCYASGEVFIWKRVPRPQCRYDKTDVRYFNEEHWEPHKSMRLADDVLDVAFSPDSSCIVSGCVTGTVFVHNVESGLVLQQVTLSDAHELPCQHVSFDPLQHYAASVSVDRTVKFYSVGQRKHGLQLRPAHSSQKVDSVSVFKGDAVGSTARRSTWSPDGALFAVPYGWARSEADGHRNCLYIFCRADLNRPAGYLAIAGRSHVCGCKFAPCLLDAFSEGGDIIVRESRGAWGPPEYRYVLAVWTVDTVMIYTSDSSARVASLTDLHYDRINDVTFSPDAKYIYVSSNDGYVTVAHFRKELGDLVPLQEGKGMLAGAAWMVAGPLRTKGAALEERVAAVNTAEDDGPVNVVKAVSKKKPKDKDKKRPRTPPADGAAPAASAAEGGAAEGGDAGPLPAVAPAPEQPLPAPPSAAEMTADELVGLLDD